MIAVAVAVGFLVATQVVSVTETHAVESREALYAARADAVVETYLWHSGNARLQRDSALKVAQQSLSSDADVVAVDPVARLHTELVCGDRSTGTMLTTAATHASLRPFSLQRGRLPASDRELVLTTQVARALNADVGSAVTVNWPTIGSAIVVGITDDEGYADPPTYVAQPLLQDADTGFLPPAYATVVNPRDTAAETPGSSGDGIGIYLLVATKPGRAAAVTQRTNDALAKAGIMKIYGHATTGESLRAQVAADVGARPDTLGAIVTGSAAVAGVVSALIIATTFAILVAQRRREVGLLRALGASRLQARTRFVMEGVAVAVSGAAAGLCLGIGISMLVAAFWTHSWRFGVVLPAGRVAAAVALGMLVTLIAVTLPLRGVSRVHPLEALRSSTAELARPRPLRAIVAAAMAVAGVVAVISGFQARRLAWVGAGVTCFAVAMLLASIWWCAGALQVLARCWPRHAPTTRLALSNAARSPSRVATTTSALTLTLLLISCVQTATSTSQASSFAGLDRQFPADIAVQSADATIETGHATVSTEVAKRYDDRGYLRGFAPDALSHVRTIPGVAAAAQFDTSDPVIIENGFTATRWLPLAAVSGDANPLLHSPIRVTEGEIGLPAKQLEKLSVSAGTTVRVSSLLNDSLDLRVVECDLSADLAVVRPEILQRLKLHTKPGLIIAKLSNPDGDSAAVGQIQARLTPGSPGLKISGANQQKRAFAALLSGIVTLLTGLLGIAALVALIGVANTLGLSTLERAREHGLLRALGMPRRGITQLLLTEAVAITAIAVAAGNLLGIPGGYLVARALALQANLPNAGFHTGWTSIAAASLANFIAAACAAILPARVASRATPTAAIAEE